MSKKDLQALNSSWNITFTSAVTTNGSVNNNTDADTGYTIEISIPWSNWGVAPTNGSLWGFDIALNDKDASGTNEGIWSNTTGGGFNDPDGWGDILFSNTTVSSSLRSDFNNDGTVNTLDWSIMNGAWGTSDATADLNNDGIVNTLDWSIMNGEWGR